ncbi:MAG TPA: ABC transporter ATP-binding protein/permease [Alteromonas australica]|uniref:ABC transporter ATP-binding protein/permease n=5 Tax=Alteromonas australica TaxID=589873 RepID=A0A075NYB5_9ALTE|nr:ABC transporter ATP-binding protein/permease [Alteromonas australica]MAF71926.1 ABC transporter ATP-binding protein/permease [Alteromonas sp.]AIF98478.1 metal ABC transporter permease [Alteromonas australica]MBU35262.1 ABC transporter ATP-binding protein/permease [Alteromonas sp.]HAI71899.1 ABC transporter ATP-binding protein/permease [Alteromonas australica]HAU26111.1 ABC transporter ATP-binding protein/permease [Alteromonas australica]
MPRRHNTVYDNAPVKWHVLKQLRPYLLEFKRRVVLALLCLVAAKLASIGLPYVLKYTVDSLNGDLTTLALAVPISLIVAYGTLRLLNVLLGEVRDTLFGRVTERAMRRIGLNVFKHLHNLDLGFHLDRRTGGLSRDIERGTSGISFLMRFMVFNIVPTLLEIGLVVGLLLFQFGWSFAFIIISSVICYVAFSMKATDWRTRFVQQMNEADSTTNSRAVDSLLNFETVKYFNNEAFEANRYDNDLAQWEVARRKNRLSLFALNAGQASIIATAMTAMMANAAFGVMNGDMTIGDFVLINAFTMQIFMPLNFLGFVYREIRGSLANIDNLFSLLAQRPAISDKPDSLALTLKGGVENATVQFENVHFSYHDARPILNGITFQVEAGKKVAIVGESGAGKSTIMKLLFRFYEPTRGTVCVNGQDISQVTQNSLRSHIAIVPQDTVLFNTTLKDNIAYGNPNATDEEIMHAASLAHLNHFIAQLPDGINTKVGERGLKLSGGEKQRVAIARALLKGAPIMIFDEATSSLDSESEQAILAALRDAAKGHTSLVIAHRLSTIIDADNILVMNKGMITEQGTHSQLLQKQGVYAKLWHTQQSTRKR